MTDEERARLERAQQTAAYAAAMQRSPNDYSIPVALLALFYLVVPIVFAIPMLLGVTIEQRLASLLPFLFAALPAVPFVWGVLRTWPLRKLPAGHVFGIVRGPATDRSPGKWIQIETLDGTVVELRLRLKAYLESTGGAVASGSIGVALCKGDQVVEWEPIPDVAA